MKASLKYIQIVNFSEFDSIFKPLIENKRTFLAYLYNMN